MQNARRSSTKPRRMIAQSFSATTSLDTDQRNFFVLKKVIKDAYGIRPAANARNNEIGQPALNFQDLRPCFASRDAMKITDHRRVRMRPEDTPKQVVCGANVCNPIPHRFVDGDTLWWFCILLAQLHLVRLPSSVRRSGQGLGLRRVLRKSVSLDVMSPGAGSAILIMMAYLQACRSVRSQAPGCRCHMNSEVTMEPAGDLFERRLLSDETGLRQHSSLAHLANDAAATAVERTKSGIWSMSTSPPKAYTAARSYSSARDCEQATLESVRPRSASTEIGWLVDTLALSSHSPEAASRDAFGSGWLLVRQSQHVGVDELDWIRLIASGNDRLRD